MAEELTLEQSIRHGTAIHLDQRPALARAAVMDRTGHELLARAALTGDQHRGIGRRDQLDLT